MKNIKSISQESIENVKYKHNCGNRIFEILCMPKIKLLLIGPGACIRGIYFRALEKDRLDMISTIEIDKLQISLCNHLKIVEKRIRELSNDEDCESIVVYISCADILTGTDYESLLDRLNDELGVKSFLFRRGPLEKRKITAINRLNEIAEEIYNDHKGKGRMLDE